jgi:2-C-methyl-D-erythritol 4-phosphate cytidylyltransferase / 2-C-methyl-D-erythritol 2,4-cyclodiphosphate synthase
MPNPLPSVAVIIAAAGSSSRMGAGVDKQFALINGHPLLWHSIQLFKSLPGLSQLIVTVSEANEDRVACLMRDMLHDKEWNLVRGGSERQFSIFNALELVKDDVEIVMVHDGARPFVDMETVRKSIAAAVEYGAATIAVPVKDTIKKANESALVVETLDRSKLWQIQTPQTFSKTMLINAHERAYAAGFLATDDAALVEWAGNPVKLVYGSYLNFKVTTPDDLLLAEAVVEGRGARSMPRVGIGYDVHRFIVGRPLMLGGVSIPYSLGLEGHSDADVLLHAISDALLGAAAIGDIGQHFPDTDPRYKGISSLVLLREVWKKISECGFFVHNVDAVLEAQEPKLAPYIGRMNEIIAEALDLQLNQVNVKATTTERLGFVGRQEGIAAQAVVMIGLKSQ